MNQPPFVCPVIYLWLALTVVIDKPAKDQAPYRVRHYTIRYGLAQEGAYYIIFQTRI